MGQRVVVYTSIVGGYDTLRPVIPYDGVKYVCFTDDVGICSNGWEIRPLEYTNDCPNMAAKHPKITPHLYFKDYEYSIWVDGNIIPSINPCGIIERDLKDAPLALHHHPRRKCVYDEYEISTTLSNVRPEYNYNKLSNQIADYCRQGLPKNTGLWECGVLIRKHNDKRVVDFMEKWWDNICNYTVQDQIPFGYLMWQSPIPVNTMPFNVRENLDYCYVSHNKYCHRPIGTPSHSYRN